MKPQDIESLKRRILHFLQFKRGIPIVLICDHSEIEESIEKTLVQENYPFVSIVYGGMTEMDQEKEEDHARSDASRHTGQYAEQEDVYGANKRIKKGQQYQELNNSSSRSAKYEKYIHSNG